MPELKPNDLPHRVVFPEPITLHGRDQKAILEMALEYLRQPDKVRIEPLYPVPASAKR